LGIPIDFDIIKDRDEAYWKQHRGTPKAFVSAAAARDMWQNRFGSLTAVRAATGGASLESLRRALTDALDPALLDIAVLPVKESGLRAGREGVDFGQLLVGLSFFIIMGALLLTGTLFVFAVESRERETGTLLAIGFLPRHVRRLVLGEGLLLAVPSCLLGGALGYAYNVCVLRALGSLWYNAVGTSALYPHFVWSTFAGGCAGGVVIAFLAMLVAARRTGFTPPVDLQRGIGRGQAAFDARVSRRSALLACACIIGVLLILAAAGAGKGKAAAGAFFGAGTLALMGGMALCSLALSLLAAPHKNAHLGTLMLSIRNCARRRGRSLALVGLLACGVFVVVAVGANRHDALRDAERRESGTGGFAYFAEASLPILHNLNSREGRKRHGLDDDALAGMSFVHMRLREGDDASCLNLNRAMKPAVLGVDPRDLRERKAFTFVKTAAGIPREEAWSALGEWSQGDPIPAVADQNVIIWALGKSVGDTMTYLDGMGREVTLKFVAGLANSILQGYVLIGEKAFTAHFPAEVGYRVLLVDMPAGSPPAPPEPLSLALRDYGCELSPAARRLADFNAVENTYLSIFLILGGLGLLLGTAGMGVMVLRTVLERRRELGMMRALGFSRRWLRVFVLTEHGFLLLAGILAGALAALLAVLPALLSPGSELRPAQLAAVLTVMAGVGLVWVLVATVFSTAGNLLNSLRDE
jgi:putative ABC transport system permease protein